MFLLLSSSFWRSGLLAWSNFKTLCFIGFQFQLHVLFKISESITLVNLQPSPSHIGVKCTRLVNLQKSLFSKSHTGLYAEFLCNSPSVTRALLFVLSPLFLPPFLCLSFPLHLHVKLCQKNIRIKHILTGALMRSGIFSVPQLVFEFSSSANSLRRSVSDINHVGC